MNFQELTDQVYNRHYQETKSADKTKIMMDDLVKIIGKSINIKKIDANTIDKIIDTLKKRGNANSSINRKLAILSKCLSYAYERNLIDKKPVIHQLKVQNEKILYLSDKEEKKLLEYFLKNNELMYYFCIIGLRTGMRAENILSLTEDDIQDGYIRAWENKGDNPYSVPMNDEVKEAVEAIRPDMFKYTINYQTARYAWNKALKELKLNEEYTIHTMRHTFCSRLVQKGVQLHIVQKLAGHKDSRMTQRYAHLSDKNLEDAINLL